MEFLTKDEIREIAPVAFATAPSRNVSNQYVFHDTEEVIDDMAQLGWLPVKAGQRKQRGSKPSVYTPHLVVFQNPDLKINGDDGDVSVPQILLKNRHDGLGSFEFMAGLFRMICSNGLVIATDTFESFKLQHKGYSFDKVRELVQERTLALPGQVTIMNDMKNRDLNNEEAFQLGLDGLLIRAGITPGSDIDESELFTKATVNQVLQATRKADMGSDLWSVFNTVQENITKGEFFAQRNGQEKARRVRSISSFEKDIQFNQELFKRATSLIPEAEFELV